MSKDDHWMQNVHPKKGALHKQLGIPMGKKIPLKTLDKAAHSSDPLLKKRAVLAETYRHAQHKKGGVAVKSTAKRSTARGR